MKNQKLVFIQLLLVISFLAIGYTKSQSECAPRQVRLLIGDDYSNQNTPEVLSNTATIIFQTYGECNSSFIKVTLDDVESNYKGQDGYREIVHSKWNGEQFCHNGKSCQSLNYDQYSHVFRLPIKMGVQFSYVVYGSTEDKSKTFKSTLPNLIKSDNAVQKILFYGDQDISLQAKLNFKRFADLKEKAVKHQSEKIDSFIFLGDYGYEFYQNNGQVGDTYLDLVEQFIAEWPTTFTPGNHEEQYDFKFFNEKFQLPNFKETKNNYFSYNQGLVHFIGINLHYFSSWANDSDKAKMLNWLENDLIKANENRKQTPWIVAFGHKSIYCVQNDDCANFPKIYRQIDDLFYNYTVDLYLGAHVHYQEFIKPMYRESIQKYEGSDNLVKYPQGMITVIQGNGGQKSEFISDFKQNIKFIDKKNPRSFEVNYHVGYGILEVHDENKICIKNINSYLNTVAGDHCIISHHKFNRDLLNTEVIQHAEVKSLNLWSIFFVSLTALTSAGVAYYLLKIKEK